MGNRRAHIVIDLGYGDSGKGTIVDALVRKTGAGMVVRFNGGSQAGHNVVTPDGRHHCFAQFGSGSFVPGTKTYLSQYMLIDPPAMIAEANHLIELGLTDIWDRLYVHEDCLVVTPYHRAVNRVREKSRGDGRHGSCGMGIGEAVSDTLDFDLPESWHLRAQDLRHPDIARRKLGRIQERMRGKASVLSKSTLPAQEEFELMNSRHVFERTLELYAEVAARLKLVDTDAQALLPGDGDIVFEGAQGVLLDEEHGFHPHTTWSKTTGINAYRILMRADVVTSLRTIGVLRAYATRHGAGPFVTEDAALDGLKAGEHNVADPWQGDFRVGWFDAVAARYAVRACDGVSSLAITCADRVAEMPEWRFCSAYKVGTDERWEGLHPDVAWLSKVKPEYVTPRDGQNLRGLLGRIERAVGVPVSIVSKGRTGNDKDFLGSEW